MFENCQELQVIPEYDCCEGDVFYLPDNHLLDDRDNLHRSALAARVATEAQRGLDQSHIDQVQTSNWRPERDIQRGQAAAKKYNKRGKLSILISKIMEL